MLTTASPAPVADYYSLIEAFVAQLHKLPTGQPVNAKGTVVRFAS